MPQHLPRLRRRPCSCSCTRIVATSPASPGPPARWPFWPSPPFRARRRAEAQATLQEAFANYTSDATGAGAYVCGSSTTLHSGPGTLSGGCAANGSTFGFAASSDAGRVHATASVAGSGLRAYGFGGTYDANALAWWGDRLTISGGAPATLALTLAWDGTLTTHVADAVPSTGFSAASANWLFAANAAGYQLAAYTNGALAEARTDVDASQAIAVNDVRTVLIPVAGIGALDFEFLLGTNASLRGWDTGYQRATDTYDGSASADFGDTGRITALRFLDAAGGDVTGSVQYQFAAGTQIYPATTAPEPSSVALAAAGLAALALARWARDRRSR